MTQEQLNTFLVKLEGDRGLQEKIKAAKSTKEVVNAAQTEGFSISTNNLNLPARISEEELEATSAGQFGSYCQCHGTICKNYTIDN
ncbi:Nif11-like leader peptide family natural product precursor [Synechococcus sp. UW179A]|uniref:Nif11-like leader peptide family natural product precursor n=1 Tax=Synechococcus sp. UW179A TaxID=2575510 RepID=UPI000E0FE270|nr:Nif11-like leader peptide family natural product precursor [Synechococcus sp. UW179A]